MPDEKVIFSYECFRKDCAYLENNDDKRCTLNTSIKLGRLKPHFCPFVMHPVIWVEKKEVKECQTR